MFAYFFKEGEFICLCILVIFYNTAVLTFPRATAEACTETEAGTEYRSLCNIFALKKAENMSEITDTGR